MTMKFIDKTSAVMSQIYKDNINNGINNGINIGINIGISIITGLSQGYRCTYA